MASFIASRASRAARAARAPGHISLIGHTSTLKGEQKVEALQADIAALEKAIPSDAGPILLRLLQSFQFPEYAKANGIAPAGTPDCIYTYMHNGELVVETPTRPSSPVLISNRMQRESYKGPGGPEGTSPASTQSTLSSNDSSEGSVDVEVNFLTYLKSFATLESVCRVSNPGMMFVTAPTGDAKSSSSCK